MKPSIPAAEVRLREASYVELRERGLTGAQLSLKLKVFYRERDQFQRVRDIAERGGVAERLGDWIRRVFLRKEKAAGASSEPR